MLCTPESTYTLRTVQISNELVLLTPPSLSEPDVFGGFEQGEREKRLEMRETVHELVELAVCMPRLERIEDVLRGQEWDGLDAEDFPQRPVRSIFSSTLFVLFC